MKVPASENEDAFVRLDTSKCPKSSTSIRNNDCWKKNGLTFQRNGTLKSEHKIPPEKENTDCGVLVLSR